MVPPETLRFKAGRKQVLAESKKGSDCMASIQEERGEFVERFIADLSSMFFLNDFVFCRPSYVTGGQKREVSDLLLVLNEECILLSVKGTNGEEKTPDRFLRWAQKKAAQATTNARVACQRASHLEISGKNFWGEEKTFSGGSLKPICGLGLVECTQKMFGEIPLSISQVESAHYPVYALSINDFLNIAMLLGSIADVFHYFKLRKEVSQLVCGLNMERPLVSYYTLKSKTDFAGFKMEDAADLSELHQLFMLDKLPEYGERDRLAGYINAVVHQLHTRHPDFEQYVPSELRHMIEPAGYRHAYLGMAARLNALPMSNKAWLGRRIEHAIKLVHTDGSCLVFHFRQLLGEVVFVFAIFTGWSRTDKLRALSSFLPAAQYDTKMPEALGVAYDADDENMGFDLLWRRGPVTDVVSAAGLAAQLFPGKLDTQCPTPFGEPRPYTPRNAVNR
jgi:hypothetical protein